MANSKSTSTRALQQFRQQCERQTGLPASEVELPLLYMLADVCDALGMSPADKRRVLGQKGVKHLRELGDATPGVAA